MSRKKKLSILIPTVLLLFIGAYARHRYMVNQIIITGTLQAKEMNEISGIAASTINNDLFYVHNDSGDTSRFFAISPNGALHSTIYYNGDATARQGAHDVEDISVGPGADSKKSYVYLADIGDNGAVRHCINIYRVAEQTFWTRDVKTNAIATTQHLKYPDGPHDAEAMMIDPLEKLIYIVTKRADSVSVFTSPLAFKTKDTVVMTFRTKLFFKGFKPLNWITAADISKDGKEVLVKSYEKIYHWTRNGVEPIWQTLKRKPNEPNYQQEKQGEAIGFSADGKDFYTTSEGVFAPVYSYKTH
ncbi:MAG: hypothetical protein V4619_07620 [Bacteroidota bacterium]